MYNHFVQEKEHRLNRELKRVRRNEMLYHTIYTQKENPKWLASYKKRMQGFIINMIDKPIESHEYKNFQYQPRPYDPSKFVGQATMYFKGFKREKERISNSLFQNASLDSIPFGNPSMHEFRDLGKSEDIKLHERAMHYKPSHTLQRIDDELKRQRMNELDYSDTRISFPVANGSSSVQQSPHQLSHSLTQSLKNKKNMASAARQIFPSLHNKSNYKALAEIFNDFPVGVINVKQVNNKQYPEEEMNGTVNTDDAAGLNSNNNASNNLAPGLNNAGNASYGNALANNNSLYPPSSSAGREQMPSSQARRAKSNANNIKKSQGIENFYPRQTSRNAMVKCGILTSSSTHNFLRAGAGKEPHSEQLTNSKLYKMLYGARAKDLHFTQQS